MYRWEWRVVWKWRVIYVLIKYQFCFGYSFRRLLLIGNWWLMYVVYVRSCWQKNVFVVSTLPSSYVRVCDCWLYLSKLVDLTPNVPHSVPPPLFLPFYKRYILPLLYHILLHEIRWWQTGRGKREIMLFISVSKFPKSQKNKLSLTKKTFQKDHTQLLPFFSLFFLNYHIFKLLFTGYVYISRLQMGM